MERETTHAGHSNSGESRTVLKHPIGCKLGMHPTLLQFQSSQEAVVMGYQARELEKLLASHTYQGRTGWDILRLFAPPGPQDEVVYFQDRIADLQAEAHRDGGSGIPVAGLLGSDIKKSLARALQLPENAFARVDAGCVADNAQKLSLPPFGHFTPAEATQRADYMFNRTLTELLGKEGPPTAKFCSNCGHELRAGDKFCSQCATPVGT